MTDTLFKMDKGIFFSSLLMVAFGIVLVYSSSFAIAEVKFGGSDFFLTRHLIRALLALICFVIFMSIDYHYISKFSNLTYVIAFILLIYVLTLPKSQTINGVHRWINFFGLFRFQVSELARIGLIFTLAVQGEKFGERMKEPGIFIQQIVRIGLICGLIIVEPDYSTAMIIACVGICLLFIAGAKTLHIIALIFIFIPIAIITLVNSSYRFQRLLGFFDMDSHMQGASYQTYQSLVALGHGGLLGVGLGQGDQKYFHLPEPHTDFVFAIIGEEIGFVGLILVLAIFCLLIFRGMRVAAKAPDTLGRLLAFGITFTLSCYVVLHTFVNTGIVPTTGVPLPFLSYGGMSLIFTMSSMGILLNISSQSQTRIVHLNKKRKK